MRKLIFVILTLAAGAVHAEKTDSLVILFPHDQASLSESFLKEIDDRIISLNATIINILGYASSDGDSLYNEKLSQNRAGFIYLYLVKKNYLPKCQPTGFGERHQLASQSPDANRRVVIYYNAPSATTAEKGGDPAPPNVVVHDNNAEVVSPDVAATGNGNQITTPATETDLPDSKCTNPLIGGCADKNAFIPGNIYGVFVGVNQSWNQNKKCAAKDAIKAQELFGSGNAIPSSITLLTDDKANRKDILDGIRDNATKAGACDAFVFYISSHGDQNGNILCADYSGLLSYDAIFNAISAYSRAAVNILIIDCCYSGKSISRHREKRAARKNPEGQQSGSSLGGAYYIYASSSETYTSAYDRDENVGSYFTNYLYKAFIDSTGTYCVSLSPLFSYAEKELDKKWGEWKRPVPYQDSNTPVIIHMN